VSWAVVMTKADKLKPGPLEKVCAATTATVSRHVAAFPQLFVTSSEKAEGIAELRAHLAGMALPKG
ncbi:MAG: YihA family ribosome biogenesis GTP-binding protein, partial [Pseudomonadota bacterium]|nr:YihA family ribosome biogenesis GTP-binding protein [Pseudomonadota bacterium]